MKVRTLRVPSWCSESNFSLVSWLPLLWNSRTGIVSVLMGTGSVRVGCDVIHIKPHAVASKVYGLAVKPSPQSFGERMQLGISLGELGRRCQVILVLRSSW